MPPLTEGWGMEVGHAACPLGPPTWLHSELFVLTVNVCQTCLLGLSKHQMKSDDPFHRSFRGVLAVSTASFNLLQTCDEIIRIFNTHSVCGGGKGSFPASLWDTWQQRAEALLFITKVFPIRSGLPPFSSLRRHYVNGALAGLHVLYLITDRAGHLGHQSE